MENTTRKGMNYLGNALKITLGAGAALGGTYLINRIREKQNAETGLSRLEQMLEELLKAGAEKKTTAKNTKK